ncbi:MAG: hypothetical protein ACI8RT_000992 [Candidatus Azotimanducaceae bacterium]|jgi:hypothetical protein|tara:strand:- start:253 stop:573 length:321 start_codon:yes stop_codon:yes gene_type:complete
MIKINHWVLLGTLVAALPLMAIDAHAQNNAPRSGFLGERGARAAPQVSLQQAIDIALSENGGRVLSAQSKNGQDQRPSRHHIRLLLDGGRVLNVVVDDRGRVQKTR